MLLNKKIKIRWFILKTKERLLVVLLFLSSSCFSQNLILNNSFENYYSCPTTNSQLNLSKFWFNPAWGTADYFNSCTSSFWVDVPQNFFGFQNSFMGNGYSGIAVSSSAFINAREYIEQRMNITLKTGKKYCASMYVSLSDSSKKAIGSMGILITTDTTKSDTSAILFGVPQIQNPSTSYLEDKDNWVKISGIYTAKGGEQFITIGNFNNDANTPVKILSTGTQDYAYYYIDDVSVYQFIEANAGADKQLCINQSVTLGDSLLPNTTYSWQPAIGLNDATAAMPTANPSATTTYTLNIAYTGPNCTGKMADTVTVFVDDCPNIYVANLFSPNNDGKNDVLKIEGTGIAMVYWGIYDRWGNLVFEVYDQQHSWDGTQRGNPCNAGTYVYYLRGTFTDGKLIEQKGNVTLIR